MMTGRDIRLALSSRSALEFSGQIAQSLADLFRGADAPFERPFLLAAIRGFARPICCFVAHDPYQAYRSVLPLNNF
jgi:hypothetical protein